MLTGIFRGLTEAVQVITDTVPQLGNDPFPPPSRFLIN
jgi:hypothetical protein